MVNHAAGPQGRDGLRRILRTIEVDLGPTELEQHHLISEADLVVQHVTLIHIWRVADGMLVEHWACRDDMGLLEQLRPS